jgi:hypothetical protein
MSGTNDDNKMQDESNMIALQEEEIKKLRAQNEHLVSTYTESLQQQVQIDVRKEKDKLLLQYNAEQKKSILEQRNPYDFILVQEEETKKATDFNKRFNALLKQVEEFSVLSSESYGMQHDNVFLPEATTDKGYIELKKNIGSKVKEQQRVWELVASKIKKLRDDYPDIQKLRHRKIKYKKKHSAATRKKNRKKEDKQVSLKNQYSYQDAPGVDIDSDAEREDLR